MESVNKQETPTSEDTIQMTDLTARNRTDKSQPELSTPSSHTNAALIVLPPVSSSDGCVQRKSILMKKKSSSDTAAAAVSKSSSSDQAELSTACRYDIVLWLFGILFIIVLHCMIFGFGNLQGWDAWSAYTHNNSNSSMERFLPEPFIPEPGVYKRSDDDASGRWYYWKLKPTLVTPGTKAFVWCCYCLHNLSAWLVLYLQQKAKTFPSLQQSKKKYSKSPDRYNWILFGINIIFHIVHLVNTHTTYDGLAADVSEASSQSSVIVALILMLFIEFGERGLLFGYPSRAQLNRYLSDISMSPIYIIRKYHGYFIYWAAIFTFWYHPMENTPGHVFGFTHTWFMMLQGSLAYQTLHLNKYWRLTLEYWVAIHALVVAYHTVPNIMGYEIWPMFFFGFSTVLILTQLYGLPVWATIPSWCRVLPLIIYACISVTAYAFIKDKDGKSFVRLAELVRIPGIYYLLLLVGWLVIVAIVKIQQVCTKTPEVNKSIIEVSSEAEAKHSSADSNLPKKTLNPPSRGKEIAVLCGVLMTYVIAVFLSWLVEYLDAKVMLLALTFAFCLIFLLIPAIGGSMLLKLVLPIRQF